jgi:hypothetical protein
LRWSALGVGWLMDLRRRFAAVRNCRFRIDLSFLVE